MTAELLRQAAGVRPDEPALEATPEDLADEQADAAARPLTRAGRRARAASPARLSPARAVAGAAVSVSGVLLGIGTLLWVSDDPSQGPGPAVVQAPVADEPAVPLEELPPAPSAAAPVVPAPAPPPPPPPPVAEPAAPALEPVTVLNNSRIEGLADRAAAEFEAGGWPVKETGNFRGQVPVTTIYHEPGQEAEARAFADRFPGIRVRPRFATLPARGLVVVVTRDRA